jgi:hypothetical protein
MKRRIAIWASVGFFVACCWTLYSFDARMTHAQLGVWILAYVTCPVTLGARYFRFYFYAALLANAATYAFVGLIVETLRRNFRLAK